MNSRSKGARGEREIAAVWREAGYHAQRTPLSGGMQWKGDVQGVPGLHIEVKRSERARLWDWLEQTVRDCPAGLVPALHFRRSHGEWWVSVPLLTFVALWSCQARGDSETSRTAGTAPNTDSPGGCPGSKKRS